MATQWTRLTEWDERKRQMRNSARKSAPAPANRASGVAKKRSTYSLFEQVGHVLRRAHQRASSIFSAEMAALELTPLQYAALWQIGDCGETSQNELGRQTAMDPATMHGVMGRLRERALVTSRADPTDGRRSLISLTPAGKKLVAAAIPVGRHISAQTLEPLTAAEQKQLLALLAKISGD